MCLVFLSYKTHSDYPLVIVANRDESYQRKSKPADFWDDFPQLLAGKDIQSNGTWLGITKEGKLALITNYRDPKLINASAPSRGTITLNYLQGSKAARDYLHELDQSGIRYNPYNLIVGATNELYYYSNVANATVKLEKGIHGLCNHLLNTSWPKVRKVKSGLAKIINHRKTINTTELLDFMADTTPAGDDELPDTGIGIPLERMLSPICIKSDTYGTKATTVILVKKNNEITFVERSFNNMFDKGTDVQFKFIHRQNQSIQ